MAEAGEDPAAGALGAVLAGGAGSRLGAAKATFELAGRPLISYPLESVRTAGLEPLVVAKEDTELPDLEVRVVRETDARRHPLRGVVAALEAAAGRPVVVVACDMPLVPAGLLGWLAGLDDPVAVCEAAGRLQPLLARYRGVGPALAAAVQRGESSRGAVAALGARVVTAAEISRFGDPERACFNLNTPEDALAAERLLRGPPGRA